MRYYKLVKEVLAHPSSTDGIWLTGDARARLLPLAERLLETSRRERFEDAHLAESLARLATRVCDYLEPAIHTRRLVLDMKGRCWSYYANTLRLQEKYDAAQEAFNRAGTYLEHTLDLQLKAEHLQNLSALRAWNRSFAEAADLLVQAAALSREVGDDATLARILTASGSHALDEGSPRKAEPPLREALELVDETADPRTLLYIHHNLTLCLAEQGRFEEARRLRADSHRYYECFDDPEVGNRRLWLDGILAAGLGDSEQAEELLRGVLETYVEARQHLHAACVGLDLAVVYARQGEQEKLHDLAEELAALCLAKKFHRETQTALHFFVQAVKNEGASATLARNVAVFVKRSARHPEIRFSPAGLANRA